LGFELFGDRIVCVDFCINLASVGMIVGKGRIYAVKGEVGILAGDFFGALTEFVPGGDAMDGDTSASNAGSAVTNVRGASEKGVEVGAHGEFVVQILANILTRCLLDQVLVTFL
jgi:hypothetical protein